MAKASEGDVGSSDSIDKYAPFVGPVVFVALGYMDPGNWATDISAGSSSGYVLLVAVLLASITAMFLQVGFCLQTAIKLFTFFPSSSFLLFCSCSSSF
jgi:Mn2+/Fe2+ NRAMP family transporter